MDVYARHNIKIEHQAKVRFQAVGNEAPEVLVTAEAVCKQERRAVLGTGVQDDAAVLAMGVPRYT